MHLCVGYNQPLQLLKQLERYACPIVDGVVAEQPRRQLEPGLQHIVRCCDQAAVMESASPNRAFMKPCSIASPNVHTWSTQGCAYTHARVHTHVYAHVRVCTGIHILRMNARTRTLRTTVCGASQVRRKRVRTHARDVKRAGTALGRHRVCVRACMCRGRVRSVQGDGRAAVGEGVAS